MSRSLGHGDEVRLYEEKAGLWNPAEAPLCVSRKDGEAWLAAISLQTRPAAT
jgi:hypothetical protein